MEEYTTGEEEVYLEPLAETTQVAEPEVQKEALNPAQKERKKKIAEKVELSKRRKQKTTNAFILDEAYSFCKENLSDKGFIRERGFCTFISPFPEIIKKRGWNLFCKHKPLGQ